MRRKQKNSISKILVFFIALPILIPILILVLIYKLIKKLGQKIQAREIKKDNSHLNKNIYYKKDFLTNCEKSFLKTLKDIFSNKYIIQPQIPLRMIIGKQGDEYGRYANELNRYIDIGIFDEDYNILALVELNDKTHKTHERYERDLKVKDICNQANIPLVTFWTHGNQTNENIRYIIEKEIENARQIN